MPRLQELRLYGVVFPPCINFVLTPAEDDIIELPLLRVLILRGTSLEAANVVRHLGLLPHCSVDIECNRSESSPSDSAGFMSSLSNFKLILRPTPLPIIWSLDEIPSTIQRGKIQFWTSLAAQVAPLIDPLPN